LLVVAVVDLWEVVAEQVDFAQLLQQQVAVVH
jgi:hypothetical protein